MEITDMDAAILQALRDKDASKEICITTGLLGGVPASFLAFMDKDTDGKLLLRPMAVIVGGNKQLFESITDLKTDEVYVSAK